MKLTLNQKIMLRVWYSYLLRVVFSKAALQGFIFGASATVFVTLVSVSSVVKNFLAIKVGEVPNYLANVFMHSLSEGELVQIVALGVIIFSFLSFKLPKAKFTFTAPEVKPG